MFAERYLSSPTLICFEGDDDGTPAPIPAPIPAPAATGDPKPPVGFSVEQQAAFNKALTEDKRKHQAQYQKIEQQYTDLLANKALSETERAKLEDSLEDVRKQLRTKEEQAKHEKRQLEDQHNVKVAELERRATTAEQRYEKAIVTRALQDAANGGDAFNPDIVVTVLDPMVKMVEGVPMIDFADVDSDTGQSIITQMTPVEAVKRMKQLPDKFGGLFKSNVVSGVGGSSATGGLMPGSGGVVDVRKLTSEQRIKAYKENPASLGLSNRRTN